jgi:hypothetical protein
MPSLMVSSALRVLRPPSAAMADRVKARMVVVREGRTGMKVTPGSGDANDAIGWSSYAAAMPSLNSLI